MIDFFQFGTTVVPVNSKANPGIVLSPHLCHKTDKDVTICDVYTKFSKNIEMSLSLKPTITDLSNNETDSEDDDICRYPVGEYLKFAISSNLTVSFQPIISTAGCPKKSLKN